MSRKTEHFSRGEIDETFHEHQEAMDKQDQEIEDVVSDVETVRRTLENLDGGTEEGTEAVTEAVEGAEDVTVDIFHEQDETLETLHESDQDYQGQIQDHSDSAQSDLGKITDAGGQIHTTETLQELNQAKAAALNDIAFLEDQIKRGQEVREASDDRQREHQRRVGEV